MAVTRNRGRHIFHGGLDLGSTASVGLRAVAADKFGLASGDAFDLMTNNNNLQLPGGTTAIGTAAMGTSTNRIRLGTQGGTVCLAVECNGTTWFFLKSGNL